MTQEFYGKDLARYKLERAREELETADWDCEAGY